MYVLMCIYNISSNFFVIHYKKYNKTSLYYTRFSCFLNDFIQDFLKAFHNFFMIIVHNLLFLLLDVFYLWNYLLSLYLPVYAFHLLQIRKPHVCHPAKGFLLAKMRKIIRQLIRKIIKQII